MASKNARRGIISQKHYCPCGGEVKMKTIFVSGKMKHMAVCQKCKDVRRRPKDFK